MTEDKKKLTLFEAACVITGLGVGGGIMAVPYLASKAGVLQIIPMVIGAYFVSVLLHLMIAEIAVMDGRNSQLVELFAKYVFPGLKKGRFLLIWFFFAMIVVTHYALMAGYIVGCGEILSSMTALPLWAGELISYVLSAGVIFFGLKALGVSEKYAIISIALVLAVLTISSFSVSFQKLTLSAGTGNQLLAFFGMLMFSFVGFFSVPQAVEGLSWNRKLIPWAVILGIGINFIFVLTVTLMSLLVSKEVTPVAIIGWGQSIGSWVSIVGNLFIFLAIITSYWSVSYAIAIIIKERFNWGYRSAWFATTLPVIILALLNMAGFIGFMRLAGGGIAVLVAVLVIPALRESRRQAAGTPQAFSMGFWGGTLFQILVVVVYILMAVGSMIPVK